MKSRRVRAGLLCVAVLASGCASPRTGSRTAAAAPPAVAQEAAPESIGDVRLDEFIIGVGDKLEISVYRNDDLTQTVLVGLSGKIMFPLVGDVQASGKSVFALRDELAEKLARYLVRPVVTVQISEIRSRRTMVLGEVKTPGSFVLDTEMSVLDALSQAGGATDDANLDRVLLVRSLGGNKKDEIYLDLKKALTGEDYSSNLAMQNGDVLYVPAKRIANIGRYASYLSKILSPIVALEGGIVLWPLVKDSINGKQSSQVSIPTSQ